MNFKEITDKAMINSVVNGYKKTKLYDLLYRFQEEGIVVAEVDISEYKSATSCTAAIKASIKRYGFTHLNATTMNGKTYIINEDAL